MNEIIILLTGTIIGALIKNFFDKKSKLFENQQNKKEQRYLCLFLLMEALINFEASFEKVKHHRPDITSKEDLKQEIYTEYQNLILFASENVICKLKEFIDKPSNETYLNVRIAMRKDLWGLKTSKKLKNTLH